MSEFLSKQNFAEELAKFAKTKGVVKDNEMFERSKLLMQNRVEAYISRSVLGDSAFYPIFNEKDEVIRTALQKLLNEPSLPSVANFNIK